jgi:hypothetical protein
MSISAIVTQGFGNGTLSGSPSAIVTFGYTSGEPSAAPDNDALLVTSAVGDAVREVVLGSSTETDVFQELTLRTRRRTRGGR